MPWPTRKATTGRRRRTLALVLAGAAGAMGATAVLLTHGSSDGEPVAGAAERVSSTSHPDAPAAGESRRATAHSARAAALLSRQAARRGERLVIGRLRRDLAAVRRRGRSPIALVQRTTALRTRPGGPLAASLGSDTEFGSPRVLAVLDRERAWLEVMAAELPNGQTGWVSGDDLDLDGVEFSLHVDLSSRELAVRRGGSVVRRALVAVGGPATPTPTGTFAVTDKLQVTDDYSPYGCCALAFTGHQPNVPQGWSGGDRLAVHATPHTATIGQAATLGCFRAADRHMRWLVERVPLGTPVEIEP
jgi:hypothetical protein